MQKIIAVFDAFRFSESTQNYAIAIARQENAHLVGVFLDDFLYSSFNIYQVLYKELKTKKEIKALEKKDEETRKKAADVFGKACRKNNVPVTIHHDTSIARQELLHESIYADLLVIDARETFMSVQEAAPTRFIKELLANTQCPVLVVPPSYQPFSKVLMLYDGAPSSVFAVRMFAYILPQLLSLPVEVISVKPQDESLHLPDNKLMKEFMKRHCPSAVYTVLKGDADTEITARLAKESMQTLVVLGAYRRNAVSRWFKPSLADALMTKTKLPLFIAHNK